MERDLAAGGARRHRGGVVEVAAYGLGAVLADGAAERVAAGQRAHGPTVGHESTDERATDEARAAGDEGGGHGADSRAREIRGGDSALARDRPSRVDLVGAQVDHRRGRAGQLSDVEDEVDARRISPGTSSMRRASGLPPGWRWIAAPAGGRPPARPASSASDGTAGRARGRAARESETPGRIRDQYGEPPGSTRSRAARVRGPSSGSAVSARSRSKNITAAGLSGRRPLSRYRRSRPRASGVHASP